MSNPLERLGDSITTAVGMNNNSTSSQQPTDPESELIKKINALQQAYSNQINTVTDSVTNHVQTLTTVQSLLKSKIEKLKGDSENLTKQQKDALDRMQQIIDTDIGNSTTELNKQVTQANTKGEELKTQLGITDSDASSTSEGTSGFVKQIKTFAINELNNMGIQLSSNQLSKLVTDKPNTVLTNTYLNMRTNKNLTPDEINSIRRLIVAEQNRLAPGRNYQQGGYLLTPHRRKRNMKSNSTRNFFKFTSKRGVKKANKKSRKKRRKTKY